MKIRSMLTLLCACLADAFDEKRVDSAIRIVARNAGKPAVDDKANAIDRDRRFGDIGGNDNFGLFVSRNGCVLFSRRELSIERQEEVTLRLRALT